MTRWTMKELEEVTDKEFILDTLKECKGRCTNYYTPLYRYMTSLIDRVEKHYPGNFNNWHIKQRRLGND